MIYMLKRITLVIIQSCMYCTFLYISLQLHYCSIGLCDRMVRTKNVEKYCENYSEAYPLTAKLLKSASISKLRAGLNTVCIAAKRVR